MQFRAAVLFACWPTVYTAALQVARANDAAVIAFFDSAFFSFLFVLFSVVVENRKTARFRSKVYFVKWQMRKQWIVKDKLQMQHIKET